MFKYILLYVLVKVSFMCRPGQALVSSYIIKHECRYCSECSVHFLDIVNSYHQFIVKVLPLMMWIGLIQSVQRVKEQKLKFSREEEILPQDFVK